MSAATLAVEAAKQESQTELFRFTLDRIASLTTDDVQSVYSGKPGCCCGCNGKHRYNSKHVLSGSKNRGYEVTADEVNDKQVKKVLNIVKKNALLAAEEYSAGQNHFAVEVTNGMSTRLYIVYPVKEKS